MQYASALRCLFMINKSHSSSACRYSGVSIITWLVSYVLFTSTGISCGRLITGAEALLYASAGNHGIVCLAPGSKLSPKAPSTRQRGVLSFFGLMFCLCR